MPPQTEAEPQLEVLKVTAATKRDVMAIVDAMRHRIGRRVTQAEAVEELVKVYRHVAEES